MGQGFWKPGRIWTRAVRLIINYRTKEVRKELPRVNIDVKTDSIKGLGKVIGGCFKITKNYPYVADITIRVDNTEVERNKRNVARRLKRIVRSNFLTD
ncbi:MAG: hypothetical protein NC548_33350 [Lachnospiraceae bacterium]|nr:hypothetical protein [Lachnospiraceae bacterium]